MGCYPQQLMYSDSNEKMLEPSHHTAIFPQALMVCFLGPSNRDLWRKARLNFAFGVYVTEQNRTGPLKRTIPLRVPKVGEKR